MADIGGGTSDFTVIRIGPGRHARPDRKDDILAFTGVRVGGTDFDTEISLDAVMPLLGRGSPLLEKGMTMPNALYRELATWATINFTYSYRNQREVTQLMREAQAPEKIARLLRVLHDRLGHRIAFAAEEAKIALSEKDSFDLPLAFIEAGLHAPATGAGLDRAIRRGVERIRPRRGGLRRRRRAAARGYRDDLLHRRLEPRARRARRHLARRAGGPRHDGQ